MKELLEIQAELKAPKGKRNNFGGFNYRSAEDILEAVKPLLKQHGCVLTLSDEIEQRDERLFVKTTATLSLVDKPMEKLSVTAFAAHPFDRKGMDLAQMTGATSSYARKYALGGLFLLDDGRDADDLPNAGDKSTLPIAPQPAQERPAPIQSSTIAADIPKPPPLKNN